MNTPPKRSRNMQAADRPRAYDPNHLHPMDEEDRKHDDTSEGIDWDEIIASTQDDWEAGRFIELKSTDYPTDDDLIQGLKRARRLARRLGYGRTRSSR